MSGKNVPGKKCNICPGGMAQGTSHQPQRQQTRFRIPPGYKVFRENIAMLLCFFDLACTVCVLKTEIKALAKKLKINVQYFPQFQYIVDGENRTKLIVNYLPQTLRDSELWDIFSRCGEVRTLDRQEPIQRSCYTTPAI
jgi:hypothetical protein